MVHGVRVLAYRAVVRCTTLAGSLALIGRARRSQTACLERCVLCWRLEAGAWPGRPAGGGKVYGSKRIDENTFAAWGHGTRAFVIERGHASINLHDRLADRHSQADVRWAN
jgi:hypothetical protein